MKELSIRINIAGRVYPLNIDHSEEERIKKVVDKIKEDIDVIETSYSIKDKQDLLAILAFQYGNQLEEKKPANNSDETIFNELQIIDEKLNSILSIEY